MFAVKPLQTGHKHIIITRNVVQAPPVRWEYDTFIKSVQEKQIVHADITQDQTTVHVTFTDSSERNIVLPTGYDHVSLLLQNEVQVNVLESQSSSHAIFSPIDATLFCIQLAFVMRFIAVDWAKKQKAKQEAEKQKEQDSIQQSGKIITEIMVGNDNTNTSDIDSVRNKLMLSMSGLVADDLIAGIFRSSPADISNILRIGYNIVLNYEILETPEQINTFVFQTYRRCRVILKHNIKYLRQVQWALKWSQKPLGDEDIRKLVEGISCDINERV
jgi:hypothetical protein